MENQQNNKKQLGSEPTEQNENTQKQDLPIGRLREIPLDEPQAVEPPTQLPGEATPNKPQDQDEWPSVSWP